MRWLWLFVFACISANAAPLESRYLASIASARDSQAVDRLAAQYEELKVTRAACRIQLHEQSVPTACYLALRLENGLHMHASEAETQILRTQLDSRCRRAALASEIPEVADRAVSAACAQWLREARAIAAYRTHGQGP